MEFWDAYDRNMKRIEGLTLVRGEPVPAGVFHLVSDIILEHSDGTYLLMQRDPSIEYGGMWEATAGGSALKGESAMDCAKRELFEETGIHADSIEECSRGVNEEFQCLFTEFHALTGCDKTAVRLQAGETIAYRWVTKEELAQVRDSGLLTERTCRYVQSLLKN